ncbi:MAG: ATP-grasp domain-containing protein [Methylococcaceae bacterium]|nr:ATP-grasp domain-containing protein [Methylococcaceae bacterium]
MIGLSARMLAVSAARSGLRPVAIDLFADSDTREVACCIGLPSLEAGPVLGALKTIVAERGRPWLVYGSGIDTRPDLVEHIAEIADLVGNAPSALRMLYDPGTFFKLLDSLSIPYPETRFTIPENPTAWLWKIPFTEGGRGVLPAGLCPDDGTGYYQKRLGGPAMSVLFLANRREARILGFNTQWTAGPDARSPYRFSGVMNHAELTNRQKVQLGEHANKLVNSASLVGLNSLDFLIEDGECKVLELNPRPGASLMLYDDRFPLGLLAEHIHAVRNLEVRGPNPETFGCLGLEIVFADRSCVPRQDLRWPNWTVDRPMPGTIIAAGEPLCTVTADAASGKALRALLLHRKQQIRDHFFRFVENNR